MMAEPVVRKIYSLSPELAQKIEQAAQDAGVSETAWVRKALAEKLTVRELNDLARQLEGETR